MARLLVARRALVKTKRRRSGMTLIELIAALVLTALMAAAGTAAFSTIVDKRESIRVSTVEVERAAALRDMIRGWIISGTIQLQFGGVPSGQRSASRSQQSMTGVTAAIASGDELSFVTNGATPVQSMDTRVRLFVDDDESTPEHGLTMEFQSSTATPLQRLELDSTITQMTVEILDRRTNRWFPSKEAATVQPLAVRLMFVPEEGKTLPALLQVPFLFRIGDPAQPLVGQ